MKVIIISLIVSLLLLYLIYTDDFKCDTEISEISKLGEHYGGYDNSNDKYKGCNSIRHSYKQLDLLEPVDSSLSLNTFQTYKHNDAEYPSICLTRTPYGFPSQESGHLSWSSRKPELPEIPNQNPVVKPNERTNIDPSCPVKGRSVPDEYYKNPDKYCRNNPNCYPCTNFWLNQPSTFTERINPMEASVIFPRRKICEFGQVPCPKLDIQEAKSI